MNNSQQPNPSTAVKLGLKTFFENAFFAEVRISTPAGQAESIGTGFLFSKPLPNYPNRNVTLLISNRHVLKNPDGPITLVFNKRDPKDPTKPVLGESFSISGHTYKDAFIGHPDPAIDLACINLSGIAEPNSNIFYRNLTDEMLSDFTEDSLLPGNDVFFIGYPDNRYDVVHNLPILRKGTIASIPSIDFGGKSEFLIDAQVFPGSSGSPVFTVIDNRYKLVGVVSETMIRNERVQAIPTGHIAAVSQILGLGIVIKSTRVRELVDHAALHFESIFKHEF